MSNNIVAISTAPGVGGIGIVRMSGPDVFEILEKFFKPKYPKKIDDIKGYSIKYGNVVDKEGKIIDEVLVSYFKTPKSYTTENMCEISSHGGIVVINKILDVAIECGAKLAEPGEFTKRAFLNGRIDLAQAEAVVDVINAKTNKEEETAMSQLEGGLSKEINDIKQDILEIMSDIEASIDYPEYDIEETTNEKVLEFLDKIDVKLKKLEDSFYNGKILRDGISTAIIGSPNAGKSSLLNLMLNEERAIVTDIEGTTRDSIEEYISIKGIPLKIIDTAGIRKAKDQVEEIGVKKSLQYAEKSDIIICIFDISKKLSDEDLEILDLARQRNSIIILNKIDLGKDVISEKFKDINKPVIRMSTKTGEGLTELYNEIVQIFNLNEIASNGEVIVSNSRHKFLIKNARENVKTCKETIEKNMPIDIISSNIREILENLNEITGDSVTDEIIDKIFSKFCLGK